MQYRAEIDGLRALAVIPVVLFHAGFSTFSGGFLGVDIFFVISGYLITSIILNEQSTKEFTLANFYERRARRILPALMLVVLISSIAAWFLLLPTELVDFGKSVAAVGIFSSNFLFWQQSDYFAQTSELIPLLHTWSLAVEEQFYLVFPLFMILSVAWLKRSRVLFLIGLAIASFIYCEWAWRNASEANFFLATSRIWELLAGVLCAFYLQHERPSNSVVNQSACLVGFGLILFGTFYFDKDTPFPSVYALAPVLGTVLIILFANGNTLIGRLLSLPPLVWIGLISYSAYLWHQPLFVFARMISIEELTLTMLVGLSVLPFVLAYLSWRWVEKPFRNRQWLSQTQILWLAIASSILLVALGTVMVVGEGFENRFA